LGDILLGSLTIPCLQEFHTDDLDLLMPVYHPELMRRSSCPLTRITLLDDLFGGLEVLDEWQPIPGVTGLVLESLDDVVEELLLKKCFPDLCHLTLKLQTFLYLWKNGTISELLAHNGPRSDAPHEERRLKLVVVDSLPGPELENMWNSDIGKQLKALDISLREDGFELFMTGED
jgi:hypothetical protein